MKKIPTLFERIYENHRVVGITEKVTPGMEWVLDGDGVATIKMDGSCCALIYGVLFKRYDAKKGKKPPEGAIPCCEPDPTTSHWPHWVACDRGNPADKWFWAAHDASPYVLLDPPRITIPDNAGKMTFAELQAIPCTFEAVGEHFQGNPYKLQGDMLIPHGIHAIRVERTFQGIKDFLTKTPIEGIVFWRDGQPRCKIKRSDFGLDWPCDGALLFLEDNYISPDEFRKNK